MMGMYHEDADHRHERSTRRDEDAPPHCTLSRAQPRKCTQPTISGQPLRKFDRAEWGRRGLWDFSANGAVIGQSLLRSTDPQKIGGTRTGRVPAHEKGIIADPIAACTPDAYNAARRKKEKISELVNDV